MYTKCFLSVIEQDECKLLEQVSKFMYTDLKIYHSPFYFFLYYILSEKNNELNIITNEFSIQITMFAFLSRANSHLRK